jgi:hypothetical protein
MQRALAAVLVDPGAAGVSLSMHPPLRFCPDITHGAVTFDNVRLTASAVLPTDGFDVLKGFRTVMQHTSHAAQR